MAQKYVVYITQGVYVDVENNLDPENNEEDYKTIRKIAVSKLFGMGSVAVFEEADIEYEDVSEEFEIE